MRNQIRKLILEAIGDSRGEKQFFGEDFIKKLNDNVFLEPLPVVSNLSEYYTRLNYILNDLNLNLIAQGHFRHVFETGNPDILLKVATDQMAGSLTAVDANLQEVNRFNRYPRFFPKSYAYDEDGVWILVEKAKTVIKNDDDFKSAIESSFECFRNLDAIVKMMIEYYANYALGILANDPNIQNFDKFDHKKFLQEIKSAFDGTHPRFSRPTIDKSVIVWIFKGVLSENAIDKRSVKHSIEYKLRIVVGNVISELRRFAFDPDEGNLSYAEEAHKRISRAAVDSRMINPIVEWLVLHFLRDRVFISFVNMIKDENITPWDIRTTNVGTNSNGELIVIDASTF